MSGLVFRIIAPGWELGSLTDREINELDISEGAAYITAEGTESVLKEFGERHQHELVPVHHF